jgi:hypothetical protein
MYQRIFDRITSLLTSVDKSKIIFEKQQGIFEEKTKEVRLAFNSINDTIKCNNMALIQQMQNINKQMETKYKESCKKLEDEHTKLDNSINTSQQFLANLYREYHNVLMQNFISISQNSKAYIITSKIQQRTYRSEK